MPAKKPVVLIEDPQSFKIEKCLIARPYGNGNKILSLIDPKTNLEIYHTLMNIPIIGLTFQPTPSQKTRLGFAGMKSQSDIDTERDDPNGPIFEPEALLVLDVDPQSLPENIDEAWVIQVKEQKNEKAYIEVAEILLAQFGMNVIITSATTGNTDPKVDLGVPVDPKFKGGAPWCPIVIRTTKTPE